MCILVFEFGTENARRNILYISINIYLLVHLLFIIWHLENEYRKIKNKQNKTTNIRVEKVLRMIEIVHTASDPQHLLQ